MEYISPAGKKFSKDEFFTYFEKKVRKTIRTNKLIGKKEKILVACSGGKDSATTAYLLKKIIKNKDVIIEGIHIDVGMGKYSSECKKNVENLRDKYKIPIHFMSFKEEFGHSLCYIKDMQKSKDINLKSCTTCGILKRYLINKKAKEIGATKVATGHNLDDEAQSIIMNMFKNTMPVMARLGPISGVGKQKGFIQRIKPLYFSLEEEVRMFSKIMGFPVKYEKCPCSSEAFRKEIRVMLNSFEENHKQTKYSIVNSLLEMLPMLKKQYAGKVSYCKNCGEPSSGNICNACKLFKNLV